MTPAKILRAGLTLRFHIVPTVFQQNVAAHSWGVAALIDLLHPAPTVQLLRAALRHDMPEMFYGDIPYSAKKAVPDAYRAIENMELSWENGYYGKIYEKLDPVERAWLEACDRLESFLWADYLCNHCGQRDYEVIRLRAARSILQNPATPKPIMEIVAMYNTKEMENE